MSVEELNALPEAQPEGRMLTAWQASRLPHTDSSSCVVLPDFLNYARLLNTGQAAAMLKLSGSLPKAFGAGFKSSPALMANPLRTAGMDFWVIAETLLRYDLALLPKGFTGEVLLHSYLADFAFVFERRQFLARFQQLTKGFRAGVQTQQLPLALTCLERWGVAPALCAFLFSPCAKELNEVLAAAHNSPFYAGCSFVADLSSLPKDLQTEATLPAETAQAFSGIVVMP